MSSYCPSCGTPRVGALRFCRSCGYDFDVLPSGATQTPEQTQTHAPTSANPAPVDRRALASYYRSTVGWGCLGRVMILGGGIVGFVLAGTFAATNLSSDIVLELVVGFLIGPAIGALIGWWLWTELWARR